MIKPLFLYINRAIIGDWRAAQVFIACRSYAHHLAPGCEILARYEDHERVGWRFWMPTDEASALLLAYHARIMEASS